MDQMKYVNTKPYAPKSKNPEAYAAYQQEDARVLAEFKADLFAEYGVTGHPKVERAFEIAWDRGHSAGLHEVEMYFEELAELLT